MGWRLSRYAVLLAVLALHALLLIGLMLWRGGIRISAAGKPLEIAFLPPNTDREKIALPPLQIPSEPRPTAAIGAPTIIMVPPQSGEGGLPQVNWAAEASRAVESAAKRAIATAPDASGSKPSSGPEWFPAPKHHAGEMVPTGNGDTMIFVNENCYQVIPMIPPIVNATHNGMGLQTYCLRGPKEPQGDLFKDLKAYKKLHPEK